jgi:hypothetical protein
MFQRNIPPHPLGGICVATEEITTNIFTTSKWLLELLDCPSPSLSHATPSKTASYSKGIAVMQLVVT